MVLKVEGGGLPSIVVQGGKLDFEDSLGGKMVFFLLRSMVSGPSYEQCGLQ